MPLAERQSRLEIKKDKYMKEEKDKQNRQQLACDFIFNNYVSYRRLRYDTIAQK